MSTKFSNWLSKKDKTSMKPAGCLDGIFQLFDRQHLLSRRQLNGQEDEKDPSGQALLSLTKQEANHRDLGYLDKNLSRSYQENSRSSMESSSPTSFSSSSISFSSLEHKSPGVKLRCSEQSFLPRSPPTITSRPRSPDVKQSPGFKSNKLLKPIDSPRPVFDLSKFKDLEESLRILIKLKELPKDFHEVSNSPRFSCDGREILWEQKGIKHAVKQKEHRRLSLDSMEDSKRRDFNSKFNSLVEELKRNTNHRISESSNLLQDLEVNEIYPNIVAKLMGLEPISPAKKSTIKASDHKNKQGNSSQFPPTSPKSQRRINHDMKFKSNTGLVVEEGRVKQKTGSVHSVKEKMLQKLQFQHNSKEISRKSSGDWNFRHAESKSEKTSISERDLLSKPASKSAYTSSSKFAKLDGPLGLRKIRTSDSTNTKKACFIVDGEQTPTRNTANSFLKSSSKETSRRTGNSSISPRFQNRKPDHEKKPSPVIPSCDLKNTQRQFRNRQQSDPVSPIGRIKQKPSETQDNEVNSHLFQQTKGNTATTTASSAKHKHQMSPREVLRAKELEKVAPPLPSPNSVLDASLYSDDLSLSPLSVSSISNDHNLKFKELPLTLHSNLCFGADSQKSETMGTIVDQFIVPGSTTDEPPLTNDDQDHKYVDELLLESDLLSKNPHTPSMLEKLNPVQPSEAGQKNNTQRLHRQLVYDVVNEILARKREAFSSGLIKHDKFSSPHLLKELRSEIKCLQSSRDGNPQDKDPIFTADLLRRSKAWDRFESEVPVVVLETERLVFADLIDEIVSSLSAVVLERKERHIRQLLA
ncbi:Protein LONGIFOLIA 1 [Platanthera guangdongensis]|uniref:Protein LONGIFOLIA 1 n=1 Tax=Platanthera guangdongensis TaxID=2320717 RepID=A0ABR2LLY8_9ASPA